MKANAKKMQLLGEIDSGQFWNAVYEVLKIKVGDADLQNAEDEDLRFLLLDLRTVFTSINPDVKAVEDALKRRLEVQEDGFSCVMGRE